MESQKPYQIEILSRQDILRYKVSGYIRSENDYHRFIREVSGLIKQANVKKVMADIRDLGGFRPGILGAIEVVKKDFLPELVEIRIAIIEREENTDNMKYHEIVAANRGYTLKYFTRPEEAEAWLITRA